MLDIIMKNDETMSPERSQLNINIDPELLLRLKSEAIKRGVTLTAYVTEQLQNISKEPQDNILEKRLQKIEEFLGISNNSHVNRNQIGSIFTDEGAKKYGLVAKESFEAHLKERKVSLEAGLEELCPYLKKYDHSDPELVYRILIGAHTLTGIEMTKAYRKGSCAMRTALSDWCNDPLEELNDAFLNAVITKKLA